MLPYAVTIAYPFGGSRGLRTWIFISRDWKQNYKSLCQYSSTLNRIFSHLRLPIQPFYQYHPPQLDPSLPAINFATPIEYSISKNDKPTATTEHLNFLQHNTDNIIVYTDGSKGQSLSSAFVIYYKGKILCEHKFSIGSRAEVVAITNAIHYLAQHPLPAHKIYIFSDNSSAISTLAQANSGLILCHRQLLQPSIDFLRNQNRQIVLNWVPSHCNIPGNERADSLAKSAASTSASNDTILPKENP
jgi:ribonuclease HI